MLGLRTRHHAQTYFFPYGVGDQTQASTLLRLPPSPSFHLPLARDTFHDKPGRPGIFHNPHLSLLIDLRRGKVPHRRMPGTHNAWGCHGGRQRGLRPSAPLKQHLLDIVNRGMHTGDGTLTLCENSPGTVCCIAETL